MQATTSGAMNLSLYQFALVYVLLLIVILIMKVNKIGNTSELLIGSIRMTLQMTIIGFILQYIFGNPNPIFTLLFITTTMGFAIYQVLAKNKDLNKRFRRSIVLSLLCCGFGVMLYFVCVVVQTDFFNPQYTIPLAGMLIGNAMTGVLLGLKTFKEIVRSHKAQTATLLNLGIEPKTILKPYMNAAISTALLPTINSMMGMGIIFLPGMVTGQLLSGTVPTTAIMYQIAIVISICAAVCLTSFFALHFGIRTLYNERNQILSMESMGVATGTKA